MEKLGGVCELLQTTPKAVANKSEPKSLAGSKFCRNFAA